VNLRVIELPLRRRCCPVRYCWLATFIGAAPSLGSDGFSGVDGNTHRHDRVVSTASVSSEPVGEYRRRFPFDSCKRFPDLRSAPGRVGQAARFCRIRVLRNDRNCVHLGHHLAGVDMVWGWNAHRDAQRHGENNSVTRAVTATQGRTRSEGRRVRTSARGAHTCGRIIPPPALPRESGDPGFFSVLAGKSGSGGP